MRFLSASLVTTLSLSLAFPVGVFAQTAPYTKIKTPEQAVAAATQAGSAVETKDVHFFNFSGTPLKGEELLKDVVLGKVSEFKTVTPSQGHFGRDTVGIAYKIHNRDASQTTFTMSIAVYESDFKTLLGRTAAVVDLSKGEAGIAAVQQQLQVLETQISKNTPFLKNPIKNIAGLVLPGAEAGPVLGVVLVGLGIFMIHMGYKAPRRSTNATLWYIFGGLNLLSGLQQFGLLRGL